MTPARIAIAIAAILFAGAAVAGPACEPAAVAFTATPAPVNEIEASYAHSRSLAVLTCKDGQNRAFPLSWQTLYRSGDRVGGGEAGLVVDKDGRPVADPTTGISPIHANSPDGTTLLTPFGVPWLVTHFEYHPEAVKDGKTVDLYGKLPMVVDAVRLSQDRASGQLHPTRLVNVDASAAGGIWTPCAATRTPWNTHLGGEEYEPDARYYEKQPLEPMNLYLGTPGKTADAGGANPYDYGHIFEIAIPADGKPAFRKRYALGRGSWEIATVMPDRRTVYMGDDGRDNALVLFVADRPNDLTSGTLYAAQWIQQDAVNGGEAGLVWIQLGRGSEDEIGTLVRKRPVFSQIFDALDEKTYKADPARYAGHRFVQTYPGTGKGEGTLYLLPRPGMETAAAFLETRRHAALRGATTEFSKMEGVAVNAADRRLYIAMSSIEEGMLEGRDARRPRDDIRLAGDPDDLKCGAVYEARLNAGVKDTEGRPIASDWIATDIRAFVTGGKKPFGQIGGPFDTCDTERIANPDNLAFSAALRTLFVAEDSHGHLNNFLWAVNVDTRQSVRILSAPSGAEITGLSVTENMNGHAYLTANIQHPGASRDLAAFKNLPADLRDRLRRNIDPQGTVGYIGGLPALAE